MKHQTKFKEAAYVVRVLTAYGYQYTNGNALHHLMVWRAGGCTRSISSPRAATTAPMHRAVGRYCITV
ncbi:hypothetical protein MGG_15597 [Pyricularia oryzae 70-15]|uniref:Uncharacterized protein n=1 Tax=Pyricularia oryzae (strain 70-15 / ATCC MYA-4617 / FGSC 8958) TaxID=242507 RepID=G4MV55_PYRO7|nr:uncharacterized protein MGG_15597 [Pyricularia oryzae 70-15]EHA54070.1 hypothetical protein MGG_15597 [Pyricularia oryzae 70-15]KAI6519605.1 hypothetical protein MCOR05_011036 [Pyricularia oryzae]